MQECLWYNSILVEGIIHNFSEAFVIETLKKVSSEPYFYNWTAMIQYYIDIGVCESIKLMTK